MHQFKSDVLLCFSNCKTYNQPDSGIYLDASSLEVIFYIRVILIYMKAMFLEKYQNGPNGKKRGARLSISAPKTPSAAPIVAAASLSEKKKGKSIRFILLE